MTPKEADRLLLRSAVTGNLVTAQSAIRNWADVNARDESDYTPLHLAAARGHANIIRLLIDEGAGIDALDRRQTPLARAADAGHDHIVAILRVEEARQKECARCVACMTASEISPLLLRAAADGDMSYAQQALQMGADVNTRDKSDYTPLHLAAACGHENIVRLLIKAGANINALDRRQTPLARAADAGHDEIVALLDDAGKRTGEHANRICTPSRNGERDL